MAKKNLAPGLPAALKQAPPKLTCKGCATGKQASSLFKRTKFKCPIGTHIHSDICGPISPSTINKHRYFVTYLDEGSRNLTVKCIPTKSQDAQSLATHINYIHQHTPYRTSHITTDNAKEYSSAQLQAFYTVNNIHIHRTIPYSPKKTPYPNASIERF